MLRDLLLLSTAIAVAFVGWLAFPLLRGRLGRRDPSARNALGDREAIAERLAGLGSWVHDLRGNSLPVPGESGWLLVTVNDHPIAWGKRSQGVIKNAYPRGLRRVG